MAAYPFQHASPEILKAMKRSAAQDKTLARIEKGVTTSPPPQAKGFYYLVRARRTDGTARRER
jgi:hypothetical protein